MTHDDDVQGTWTGSPLLTVALILTMASGLVVATGAFVDLPAPIFLTAAACFLIGVVMSGFASARAGRRAGIGLGRAMGRGISDGFRWLLKSMP